MAKLRQAHARKNGSAVSAPATETTTTPAAASILVSDPSSEQPTEPLDPPEPAKRNYRAEFIEKYPEERGRMEFEEQNHALGYLLEEKLRREIREEVERLIVINSDRQHENASTAEMQHLLDFLRDWRTHGNWNCTHDGSFYAAALRSLASLSGISADEARTRLFPDQEDPAA